MSYILDALKKSEQQRPQGPVPDLFAVHGPQPPAPRRNPWPSALLAVALAMAGGGVWVGLRFAGEEARPREQAPQVAPVAAPVPAATAQTVAPAVARQPVAAAVVEGARKSAPARQTRVAVAPVVAREPVREIPLAPPSPKGDTGGSDVGVASVAAQSPVATPASASPVVPVAPGEEQVPPPDGTVLELAALPEAVRAEIPAIAISGHVWSEEASLRMLTLQDRILREGSEAAPGVRVEEITPEGAVLSFKGYRYRVGGF